MNDRMTKNYKTDGGNTWVIGGKLVIEEGAEVEGLGEGGGGGYTLPKASADTLGGVKVGAGLSVDENGVLSADGITPAANQAALEATEVADVVTAFNALLTKLKTAGIMTADTEPGE